MQQRARTAECMNLSTVQICLLSLYYLKTSFATIISIYVFFYIIGKRPGSMMVVCLVQRLLEEPKQSTLTNSGISSGSTLFVKVKTISNYRSTS